MKWYSKLTKQGYVQATEIDGRWYKDSGWAYGILDRAIKHATDMNGYVRFGKHNYYVLTPITVV